jgi:TRAP-type C4-dicarboxylate transport system permease small subunit
MYRISYWINRLSNGLHEATKWFLITTGAAMSVIVLLQVFFRFVIYIPFPWSEESARYLMIWMGMVGAAAAMRYGRHIGVTVLIERLPPRVYRFLSPFTDLAMVAFLVVMAREGFRLAVENAVQYSPAMNLPMLVPYLAIPIGAALMILEITASQLQEFFPTEAGSMRKIVPNVL